MYAVFVDAHLEGIHVSLALVPNEVAVGVVLHQPLVDDGVSTRDLVSAFPDSRVRLLRKAGLASSWLALLHSFVGLVTRHPQAGGTPSAHGQQIRATSLHNDVPQLGVCFAHLSLFVLILCFARSPSVSSSFSLSILRRVATSCIDLVVGRKFQMGPATQSWLSPPFVLLFVCSYLSRLALLACWISPSESICIHAAPQGLSGRQAS